MIKNTPENFEYNSFTCFNTNSLLNFFKKIEQINKTYNNNLIKVYKNLQVNYALFVLKSKKIFRNYLQKIIN